MTINHNYYLDLAFKQAEINLGKTKLNPSVGSVLVQNNSVISSGVTSINGRPHSEFNTLNKKINFKKSALYVTLEPCTHKGLTSPCVDLIIKKKIENVYYCFNDPDERTYKKAKVILKKNKVRTKQLITKKYKDFYNSYFINKKNKVPYISAKIAVSKDYFTINNKSKWITNSRSRTVAHLLRSKFDCIISTSKSINEDNSLLNCRLNGMNKNKPDLFIIDLKLKLRKNLLLTKFNFTRKTYIITTSTDFKKKLFYEKLNYKIITIKSLINKHDFQLLFKKLFKLGYGRVLFETGLTFLNELISNKYLNNLYIFQSNQMLKKNGRNRFKKIQNVNLNNDKLYETKIK